MAKLKVTHVCPVTPNGCGLYETVRELAWAERKLGINARIFDPRPYQRDVIGKKKLQVKDVECPKCKVKFQLPITQSDIQFRPPAWAGDRGVCIVPLEEALKSDILVSHSGLEKTQFGESKIPRIHVAHGRPNSSYRLERTRQSPIYKSYHEMSGDDRWKVMITLWPGYEHFLKLLFPRVVVMNAFVDLDFWKPLETKFDFDGKTSEVNIVTTDIWRMDKDPFWAIHAFAMFAENCPGAKLHIYGLTGPPEGRNTLLECLDERGILGDVKPMVNYLRDVYNAADVLVTPHKIATRVVREALACGTQVVAGAGNPYTPYTADIEDLPTMVNTIERAYGNRIANKANRIKENRKMAEQSFNIWDTAKEFIKLFERYSGKEV